VSLDQTQFLALLHLRAVVAVGLAAMLLVQADLAAAVPTLPALPAILRLLHQVKVIMVVPVSNLQDSLEQEVAVEQEPLEQML